MINILFMIHDLGSGGAEKVLVNLVNNMDTSIFHITVMALFGNGENERYLNEHIRYKYIWKYEYPANSKILKLFTPEQLHKLFIKEQYDIEVAYLEGPSARIISGCPNKETILISWIHREQHSLKAMASSFRSEEETLKCYGRFKKIVCVAKSVMDDINKILKRNMDTCVCYNSIDTERIIKDAKEVPTEFEEDGLIRLIAVGTLKESKGYIRLLHVVKNIPDYHLYILGKGPLERRIREYIADNKFTDRVTLLGYQTNPYKYLSHSDLFVCASFMEGFSTAATEALVCETPVCTVDVSGMKEMLGEKNEWGVVTENSEEALRNALTAFAHDPAMLSYYRQRAAERGKVFNIDRTVKAVEEAFLELVN